MMRKTLKNDTKKNTRGSLQERHLCRWQNFKPEKLTHKICAKNVKNCAKRSKNAKNCKTKAETFFKARGKINSKAVKN